MNSKIFRNMDSFYVMWHGKSGPELMEQSGYSDGIFNYYTMTIRNLPVWYAIDPVTGLSVAKAETLIKAHEIATSKERMKMLEQKQQTKEYRDRCLEFFEAKKSLRVT